MPSGWMRSIFVWYFIKMKTWGIFYFLRRHFRYLCGTEVKTEESGKWSLYTWHSFALDSLHTYQEIQCTVSNREPYRGEKCLRNFTFVLALHTVSPPWTASLWCLRLPGGLKKIDVSGKLFDFISDKKKCFRRKHNKLHAWDMWFWQSILYAHTVIATVFTGVLRVNCVAAQKHTLGCIQGSYMTWAGPWRTWFD